MGSSEEWRVRVVALVLVLALRVVRGAVEADVDVVVEFDVSETERGDEASWERNAVDSFDMILELRSRFWWGSSFAG